MWVYFWLAIGFVILVESLLLKGLQAWWGEAANGWSAALTLAICFALLRVFGYALDARQRRDMWEKED